MGVKGSDVCDNNTSSLNSPESAATCERGEFIVVVDGGGLAVQVPAPFPTKYLVFDCCTGIAVVLAVVMDAMRSRLPLDEG